MPAKALDAGSAIVEGIAAVAVVFMLFAVLVQAATALVAHQTAEAAVDAAARRTAMRPGRQETGAARLLAELEATVPGARNIEAGVRSDRRIAHAWARFDFVPPGPMFRPFTFAVEAEVPVVVAP